MLYEKGAGLYHDHVTRESRLTLLDDIDIAVTNGSFDASANHNSYQNGGSNGSGPLR